MKIDYDPNKSYRNAEERGLPFDLVEALDWVTAKIAEDARKAYPERHLVAGAYLGERLHVVCFTPLDDGIRVISFRKANKREVKAYENS